MGSDGFGIADAPIVYVEAEPFSWRWFAGVPRLHG